MDTQTSLERSDSSSSASSLASSSSIESQCDEFFPIGFIFGSAYASFVVLRKSYIKSSKDIQETFEITRTISKIIGEEKLLMLLGGKNELGNNFLIHSSNFSDSVEIFKEIWEFYRKMIKNDEKLKEFLLIEGENGKNLLHTSIFARDEKIFEFIFEEIFCNFLGVENFVEDKKFLEFLIKFGSESMMKFSLEKLKEKLSIEIFRKFLKLKNEENFNIFHFLSLNKNFEALKYFLNFIKLNLTDEEFKNLLSEKNCENFLPFHFAIEKNSFENFTEIFSNYREKFKHEEICEFLKSKSYLATLNLALRNENEKKMFGIVHRILEIYKIHAHEEEIEVESDLENEDEEEGEAVQISFKEKTDCHNFLTGKK